MANSLLDFVMSVVRDPDVASRYAADPAQAIADAHLTGVTTADVNGLIPVVTESISAAPATGVDVFGDGGNVWSSGAATAAFDAFDHLPVPEVHDPVITDLVGRHDDVASTVVDTGDDGLHSIANDDDPAWALDAPVIHGVALDEALPADDLGGFDHLHQPTDDPHLDTPGFDLYT
ncbi:Rv0340 family IniB-related protein [Mycolicibacterium sediminis]|uniref:Uncharacterized protein n=1 Tax=Mycolicibacterium sediminis TaxID=1286180 RepID=A0A7I7QMT4_9MYCO|nr:IniB N-terminal domain-containing protein [Mycolicibacterium sediminis]BBY27699.1 hypothetical protein MSEDJ_17950 [Mycolicibacterium sediminis]